MVTNSVKELYPSFFANHRQMLGMDSRVVWNNPDVGSSMTAHNITETLNSMKESTQFSLDSMKVSTDALITVLKDSMQASFAGQQESINTLRTEIHSQKSQSWVLIGIFGAAVLSAVAGGFVLFLKTLNVV